MIIYISFRMTRVTKEDAFNIVRIKFVIARSLDSNKATIAKGSNRDMVRILIRE